MSLPGTRWLGLAALLVVLAIVVVLSRQPPIISPRAQLEARPEASLYYPGSTLIRSGGHLATTESRAEIWRMLGTEASVADVIAFYRSEATTRGLEPGGGLAPAGIVEEGQVCAWHNPEFVLRLSFWRLDEWRSRYPDEPSYATVYEVRLLDQPNTVNLGECRYESE